MSSLNKVLLIGRVGQKPTVNYTQSGKAVANFTLATNGYGKDDPTEWHRIVAWEKLAEICQKFVDKGKLLFIEGRITTRSYEKNGQKMFATDIIAHSIQFLSAPEKKEESEPQLPMSTYNFDSVPF